MSFRKITVKSGNEEFTLEVTEEEYLKYYRPWWQQKKHEQRKREAMEQNGYTEESYEAWRDNVLEEVGIPALTVQFAGVYVRLPENRLVFPVTAYNAVHAGVHELVQCRIFFQSNPSSLWCRSLPLFWRDCKRKKKKAGKPSCSVRHFLIKYPYGVLP